MKFIDNPRNQFYITLSIGLIAIILSTIFWLFPRQTAQAINNTSSVIKNTPSYVQNAIKGLFPQAEEKHAPILEAPDYIKHIK